MGHCRHVLFTVAVGFVVLAACGNPLTISQNAPGCDNPSLIQLNSAKSLIQSKSFTSKSFNADFEKAGLHEAETPERHEMQSSGHADWPQPNLDFGETFFNSPKAAWALENSRLESQVSMLKTSVKNRELASYILRSLDPKASQDKELSSFSLNEPQSGPLWPLKVTVPLESDAGDSPALAQRVWSPVERAAQTITGRLATATGLIQAPLLFVVMVVFASSSFAMFCLGGGVKHNDPPSSDEDVQADDQHWFSRASAKGGSLRPEKHGPSTKKEMRIQRNSTEEARQEMRKPDRDLWFQRKSTKNILLQEPSSQTSLQSGLFPQIDGKIDFSPWTEPLPESHYLCSGLVVPRNSECILAVQTLDGTSRTSVIRDLGGHPALEVDVKLPDFDEDSLDVACQQPVVTLRASQDNHGKDKILAQCKIEHRAGELRDRALIFTSDGTLFATLCASYSTGESLHYVLTSVRGSIQLSLEGDFEQHVVNVWSETRLLFGDSTPQCKPSFDTTGQYWQLRVLANMDVCLILAALLCAEIIEGSSDRRPFRMLNGRRSYD